MKKTIIPCLWRCFLAMGLATCTQRHYTPAQPTPRHVVLKVEKCVHLA
jgi:hypothetical protein